MPLTNQPLNFFDLEPVLEAITKDNKTCVAGLYDSALSLFILELVRRSNPVILLTATEKVDRYYNELARLVTDTIVIDDKHPYFLPARAIVATKEQLTRCVKSMDDLKLVKKGELNLREFLLRLQASGFEREENVEDEYEYALRGGILDLFVPDKEPVRIELYGDIIHSLRRFNTQTQRSTDEIENFAVALARPGSASPLCGLLSGYWVISHEDPGLNQPLILISAEGAVKYNITPARHYFGDFKAIREDMSRGDYKFIFLLTNAILETRLKSLLGEIRISNLPLTEGFIDEDNKTVYLTDTEIFGRLRPKKETFKGLFIDDLKGLKEEDYVVHSDYGIGQYRGLVNIDFENKQVECLRVDYAGNARIYVPVEKLNQLERYVSSSGMPPKLSRLGSDLWIRTRERVKKATEKLALDLLQLYAQRQNSTGFPFSQDAMEMAELETAFPYQETDDQSKAIKDVKIDMESAKPLDRLICGDVGYGKTEIALRAAFKAALDGKQTMLLCPTTLLAFQHYNTFKNRLAVFPLKPEMVSRLRKKIEIKKILEKIRIGVVDIAIGTHRLLQPDVQFKDLGLLIIDEEQRFGVIQKEKIKKLKPGIDILYLSATPIPRTLYMALTGIKDISNIRTPPSGRRDIVTKIIYFDEDEIKKIIKAELMRGGQVFFVHNRIQTIETISARLHALLPDLKICVLHGKVKEEITERKMIEFLEGKYDLLLSTAIIESGLDMPRVNTIIVNEVHKFGLADLHQLRGRVGRSDIQAYAYFIVPQHRLTEEANKRLSALVSYASLGSGFRLALRDLEIRGIGNLLGKEQSGQVNAIGYQHYVKMLGSAVNELKGIDVVQEPLLSLNIDAYFPTGYIESAYERTALYKRLMEVESKSELGSIKEEIIDRFGRYPAEVENLFVLSEIRLRAIELNAGEVTKKGSLVHYYAKGSLIKTEELNQTA